MKPLRIPQASIVIIPVISLIFLTSIAFGQTDTDETDTLDKSPQSEEFHKKALEKLQKMSPEEVEDLDKKLAEALTLFYDKEYARAIPIFTEISDTVETMDVMFWYGSCAAKAGETDLAINKFRQMLDIDPDLHRVRLELATVYFGLGRYADARNELNSVLEAKPPDAVKNNIEKLLAAIDAKTKRLFTNVRGSLGFSKPTGPLNNPMPEGIQFFKCPG